MPRPLKCAPVNGRPTLPWRDLPGFDGHYGLEILTASDEEVTAQVRVRDELKQPAGLVHGGVFASIAESMTSIGTWLAVRDDGYSAQGLSNQTSFLRPILDGRIHAVARRRHRGRTTWVWEVEITDDQQRLCALVRVRASMLNGCAYCVDMHTKDARAQGETEQRLYAVATWHEAPFFSAAERAALALTDALTLLAGNPLPDHVVAEAQAELGADGLAAATWIIVT